VKGHEFEKDSKSSIIKAYFFLDKKSLRLTYMALTSFFPQGVRPVFKFDSGSGSVRIIQKNEVGQSSLGGERRFLLQIKKENTSPNTFSKLKKKSLFF